MEQNLESNSLHAFEMMVKSAGEYSGAEFKFYKHGFVRYVVQGVSVLIEDIYIIPEFRGTPASSIVLSAFTKFLKNNNTIFVYGHVMKACPNFKKRMDKFERWGAKSTMEKDDYHVVATWVKDLK